MLGVTNIPWAIEVALYPNPETKAFASSLKSYYFVVNNKPTL
jgi:hypothetical protein